MMRQCCKLGEPCLPAHQLAQPGQRTRKPSMIQPSQPGALTRSDPTFTPAGSMAEPSMRLACVRQACPWPLWSRGCA